MRNNLLWFHVITGHHADTRAEVCVSLAWQAGAPSLPISPGKGLMGWLYCGPHSCWCLPLPAPVTTLFNKHEPISGPDPLRWCLSLLSLMCMGSQQYMWLNKICKTQKFETQVVYISKIGQMGSDACLTLWSSRVRKELLVTTTIILPLVIHRFPPSFFASPGRLDLSIPLTTVTSCALLLPQVVWKPCT